MTGVLFIGGMQPPYKDIVSYLPTDAICVAADSGYDYASAHSIPISCIIGDMDSIQKLPEAKGVSVIKFIRDKNFTDTEIGLAYLKEFGCNELIMVGGGGGRLDHVLQLCKLYSEQHRTCTDWHRIEIPTPNLWITDTNVVLYVAESQVVHFSLIENSGITPENFLMSVFPCDGYNDFYCKSSGLFWPLDSVQWRAGETSVSNKLITDTCSVTAIKGAFICILPLSGWRYTTNTFCNIIR